MGFLSFRLSTEKDIPFYESLFKDSDWILDSGFRQEDFHTKAQLLNFISKHKKEDVKGIVYDLNNNHDIGFCHFKYLENGKYEICGGIRKELLDKGYGIHSFVFCINYLFQNYDCSELHSVVYEFNNRSRKMDVKTGFVESGFLFYDTRKFFVYVLTPSAFYNCSFVNLILNRNK